MGIKAKDSYHTTSVIGDVCKCFSQFFDTLTRVEIYNRFIGLDIRDQGNNLKKLDMLIFQDTVWKTVKKMIGHST